MSFNKSRNQSSGTSESTDPRIVQAYLDNLATARDVASNLPQQQFAQPSGTFMAGRDQLLQGMGYNPGTMGTVNQGSASAQDRMRRENFMPRGAAAAAGSPGSASAGQAVQGRRGPTGHPMVDHAISTAPPHVQEAIAGQSEQGGGDPTSPIDGLRFSDQLGGAPRAVAGQAPTRMGEAAWQPAMQGAIQGAQGVMSDVPSFLQGNMSAYMNPYQDEVIDRSLQDLDRARQMAMQGVGDQAAGAGAFGGSRQGVLEAETNRGFFDRAGNLSAQMRQQGFGQAADLMGQDMNRQMQGRQQQLGASGLLGQLSGQQRDMMMGDAQAVMNLGLGEQQMQQQQLDAYRNQMLEQQNQINAALGLVPGGAGGTSSQQSSGSAWGFGGPPA